MILECPNCQTRFSVPDGAIGSNGRKVRCASCKHVWHATVENDVPSDTQAAPAVAPPSPPMDDARDFGAGDEIKPEISLGGDRERDDDHDEDHDDDDYHPSSLLNRATGERAPFALIAGWTALVVFVAGVLTTVFFFDEELVKIWPSARVLYEDPSHKADTTKDQEGDEPEVPHPTAVIQLTSEYGVEAQPDGRNDLVVTGSFENTSDHTFTLPRVRGVLRDARKQIVHSWTFAVGVRQIEGHQKVNFNTRVKGFPESVAEFELFPMWEELGY